MIWNDRMRHLREESDITLEEMASRLGVAISTAQRYEKSNGIKAVPYEVITEYAKVFDVSPSYIMGWQDERGSFLKSGKVKAYDYCKGLDELIADIYRFSPEIREEVVAGLRNQLAFSLKMIIYTERKHLPKHEKSTDQ